MKKTPPGKGKTSENIDFYQSLGIEPIPFKTRLSFVPLIEYINDCCDPTNFVEDYWVKEINRLLAQAPELLQPIEDPEILEKYPDVVDMLLSVILPPGTRHKLLAKVAAPFNLNSFYQTPALQNLIRSKQVRYRMEFSSDHIYGATVIGACGLILNKFYGQNITVDPPIAMTFQDAETGLDRHFKTKMDLQFVDVKKTKPLKPLSQEQINQLFSNIYDLDLWLKHLPPENFEFHGFLVGELIEITTEEALSQLKFRLLRKDAVVNRENINELERLVRTYLNLPDLRLGITAIDYPPDRAVAHRYKIRFDLLADQFPSLLTPENHHSIYEKACKYKEVLLIEDLRKLPKKTPIEQSLINMGILSIIVAPLFNQDDEVIGLLELGSPKAFELHSFVELKLKDLSSLFNLAMERSREEIDNQIEAIIREQFTSVHPSVEWRFIEASYNLLNEREQTHQAGTIEPIVFHDVYPLYGQSDIVNSSEMRNQAIQADLLDNLNRLRKTIRQCLKAIRFPLLNHLLMKVEKNIAQINREFSSSDESHIVDLLIQEAHPALMNLKENHSDLVSIIAAYFENLDPDLGIIYRQRKDYEESVGIINNTIANYLEQQEKESQKITPHYFEKYRTDGVEYDIYVGQSLLKKGSFCMIHLYNLRLWQLLHMIDITRQVAALQDKLPVPMTTAQLIFAYTAPLSIRFRMDEKQFDVDGAYNVRYEILKKRIDKATIEGTGERLTLSGKIAIVYLQEKDRQEYMEYIEYLRHEGLVTGEVEDLQLARLQGVQGLRALRITVTP